MGSCRNCILRRARFGGCLLCVRLPARRIQARLRSCARPHEEVWVFVRVVLHPRGHLDFFACYCCRLTFFLLPLSANAYLCGCRIPSADEKEEGKLVAVDKRKAHERAITRLEEEVKEATSKMNGMKMKSTIATSLGFFVLYRTVASSYAGIVIARLPFVPFKMLRSFTHRGLEEEDVYACGFGFIYSLATMAFKQNLPKALGFAPPRSAYDPSKAAARMAAKADFE